MDHDAVLALFDRQMRQNARAEDPGARIEKIDGVVRQVGASGDDWSGVLWSDLTDETADAAIAAQVEHFGSLGRAFEWKLYAHDQPTDLAERLLAAGFRAEPEETLMVAQVDGLSTGVDLPEGVHLQQVTGPAGVVLAADVHEQAFGTSAARLRHRMLAQLSAKPEAFSVVVAMAGDLPVSAARMEMHRGTEFAGLWGGGTVAAWRGRGIYSALVAHRARIAAGLGYRYLQVDATDQSRPILDRLGFAALSTTTPYAYKP